MGYTTEFSGSFKLDRPLTSAHLEYLKKFANTRRMKRNVTFLANFDDPERVAADLPIGFEGEFFVGGRGFAGQDDDKSVVDHNYPPSTQPGLWCQWVPNEDGTAIEWDGGEKFYEYVEWIQYMIASFFKRWDYTLNGRVLWRGEDIDDIGTIVIENNVVHCFAGDFLREGAGSLSDSDLKSDSDLHTVILELNADLVERIQKFNSNWKTDHEIVALALETFEAIKKAV